MRWFKHFTDNHRGRTVQTLLDKVGHDGVVLYYILMELCAEKLEKQAGRNLTEDDCRFTFSRRTIENQVRCKWVRIEKGLTCIALAGILRWSRDGEDIEIKMPILLDLLDRDLKGTRSRRARDAQKPRLESESELESEPDKEGGELNARPTLSLVSSDSSGKRKRKGVDGKEEDFFGILNPTQLHHIGLTKVPEILRVENFLLHEAAFGRFVPAVFHKQSKSKMLATLVHVYEDPEFFRNDLNAIISEKNTAEKNEFAKSDYIATRVKNKALELYNARL
jgi:hypothetical protein